MASDSQPRLDRRAFLQTSALATGALCVGAESSGMGSQAYKTKRVIVVAFAGGVRTKEVLDTPANAPNIAKIAAAGVTFPNVRTANLGHYGAALSIFTGASEAMSIRDNRRGLNPTVFEYLRKSCGFSNMDVWLSTANGAQGRLFAHSEHPDFGAQFGANVLDSDGIFNKEFKDVLESFGKPTPDNAETNGILDELSAALDPRMLGAIEGKRPDAKQVRQIERFILDELRGKNTKITGPGAGDAKAIRVGHSIFRVFQPRMLAITLQNADVAHGSYNAYVEVIRRNDAEIGKLWTSIQADPELRATTTLVLCPEFGRDAKLNQRNGLDHGDQSDEMRKVFLIATGPDFKTNKIITKETQTLAVCPTVLSLFSKVKPKFATASVIKDAFA